MVAIGLVLELPELRYELKLIVRESIPYFRYRIFTPSERRIQLAKVIAFIGWILIVAGVAGERVAEVKVKDFDLRVQGCSDAKVREATLEAGDANQKAGEANERASENKKEATLIEESLTGRKLSPEDTKALSQGVSRLQGQHTVWIRYRVGDAEAEVFAWDIAKALHDAKWNVYSPAGIIELGPIGVLYKQELLGTIKTGIGITSTEEDLATAQALALALRDRGFDAQADSVYSNPRSKDMELMIRARPRGPQGEAKLKREAAKKTQAQSSRLTK
jgi:hypothetical protein